VQYTAVCIVKAYNDTVTAQKQEAGLRENNCGLWFVVVRFTFTCKHPVIDQSEGSLLTRGIAVLLSTSSADTASKP
jgi:hypothetical protein